MLSHGARRRVALVGGQFVGLAMLWSQTGLAQEKPAVVTPEERATLINVKVNPDGSVAVVGIQQVDPHAPPAEAVPAVPPPPGAEAAPPGTEEVPPGAEEIPPPADGKAPCPCPNPCAPLPPEPGRPIPQSEPFQPPPKNPLKLLCKIHKTPPLQRPPFAGKPVDSLKGMAAGINAVQLDAKNRALAAEYLGTVDCVLYPQAREMLIQTMLEDPNEEVRYAAVRGLEQMLGRGQCNQQDGWMKHAKTAFHKYQCHLSQCCEKIHQQRQPSWNETARYDACRGCCEEKTLNALAKVAYGTDAYGCPIEPSERIRETAKAALALCPCEPAQLVYPVMGVPTVPAPPAEGVPAPPEELPQRPLEETPVPATPDVTQGPAFGPVTYSTPAPATRLFGDTPPPVKGLRNYCPVALKERRFVMADPRFSAVYEGRTYYCANEAALAEFRNSPQTYAPAYWGCDPIVWMDHGKEVEGVYLREYKGRFYLFASKENWEKFQSAPDSYELLRQ